ncbi:RQC trigger complex subunit RQT4 [Candida tropicalis]
MSRNKSTTTSQLLKSKSTSSDPVDKQTKKKNLVNLQDIETILNELETNDSATFDTSVRRVCNYRAFKLAEEELRKTREAESIAKEEQSQNPKKSDADLERAKERLETLLDYQATGAERTRIIDNASDFEMPSQSLWLTPEERALNLKKQQRLMRENQFNRDRKSRGERTVEMSIKDGKVTMIEKFVSHKEDISTDEKQLEDTIKEKKQQAANANDSIWDYDKDRLKWEKPIYFTTGDSPKPIESNELQIKNRVQFSKEDASDLIATLIN